MNRDERKADYERSAQDPVRWQRAAENLFEAATHLSSIHENAMREVKEKKAGEVPVGFNIDSHAHYFQGKCIELYLKCLLVSLGTTVTKNGALISEMQKHEL